VTSRSGQDLRLLRAGKPQRLQDPAWAGFSRHLGYEDDLLSALEIMESIL